MVQPHHFADGIQASRLRSNLIYLDVWFLSSICKKMTLTTRHVGLRDWVILIISRVLVLRSLTIVYGKKLCLCKYRRRRVRVRFGDLYPFLQSEHSDASRFRTP